MIIAAAIVQRGRVYALPAPARHHDVIHHMAIIGEPFEHDITNQGFIDSDRGFVRRSDAWQIVIENGQPLRDGKNEPDHVRALYSEDLW